METQAHYQQRALLSDKDVHALFAIQPGKKAVVFIHGYGGDVLSAWSDFDRMLPERSEFSACDLLFYGYDGLYSELVASAGLFHDFLTRLFQTPLELINPNLHVSVRRKPGFAYNRVVLVAHSLGAVIARWALLQATAAKKDWVGQTRMVLFAPAHTGAKVVELASGALGGNWISNLFSGGARFVSPLIDQLKPGSPELEKLRKDTEEALKAGKNSHLIAKKVFIAEKERIVSNLPFCQDPQPIPIRDKNHRTVCKPKPDFMVPIDAVRECL